MTKRLTKKLTKKFRKVSQVAQDKGISATDLRKIRNDIEKVISHLGRSAIVYRDGTLKKHGLATVSGRRDVRLKLAIPVNPLYRQKHEPRRSR